MSSLRKRASSLIVTSMTALLLGHTAMASAADSGIEYSSGGVSPSDKITAITWSFGTDKLAKTNISVDDLQKMQEALKDQARQIEELKRSNGSSSSSNSSELSDLKRTVSEQDRELNNLGKQVEDLKRSNGSSSSSSSSELASLKREVSDQDRTLDQLKRTVEELSRKVK